MINRKQPDKPFKTIEEQIEILDSRKLIIDNQAFAQAALFTYSYYDLINGYKEVFMIDDEFRPNTTIEDLYLFAKFDRSLQNILFQYSVIVETSFKTALAYVLSEKYGEFQEDYLNIKNFNQFNKKELDQLKSTLNDIRKAYTPSHNNWINEPTWHYVKTKNHVPAWILFKNISFDLSTKLYSHLKSKDKEDVCNIMLDLTISTEKQKEFLNNSLNIIRRFRNIIAHNLKFITYKDNTYKITKSNLENDTHEQLFLESKTSYNNAYSMIICLNSIVKDPSLKFEMNLSILQLIDRYRLINPKIIIDYFNITGIPHDYEERIKNILNNY
uniref:Abi family protein n=1 Tax=Anaerococcus mediterraneensis TaxID=1870984 RepID=UPI00092FED43|nr:Abi family protein [Anaerococcus mediterraneensis]